MMVQAYSRRAGTRAGVTSLLNPPLTPLLLLEVRDGLRAIFALVREPGKRKGCATVCSHDSGEFLRPKTEFHPSPPQNPEVGPPINGNLVRMWRLDPNGRAELILVHQRPPGVIASDTHACRSPIIPLRKYVNDSRRCREPMDRGHTNRDSRSPRLAARSDRDAESPTLLLIGEKK